MLLDPIRGQLQFEVKYKIRLIQRIRSGLGKRFNNYQIYQW